MSPLAAAIPSPAPTARQPLRLVMHGAAGRMGQRIIACAGAEPAQWMLVAAVDRAGHPRTGTDAGTLAGVTAAGVAISDGWSCSADVVIDFSLPGAVAAIAAACVARKVPLVVATTGLEVSDQTAIHEAAKQIAILQSPSMSLAVNVAMDLVSRAAAARGRRDPPAPTRHSRRTICGR